MNKCGFGREGNNSVQRICGEQVIGSEESTFIKSGLAVILL